MILHDMSTESRRAFVKATSRKTSLGLLRLSTERMRGDKPGNSEYSRGGFHAYSNVLDLIAFYEARFES